MSKARLTRREVGWLLAQEARGAADALRRGVSQLTTPEVEVPIMEAAPLETTLDALDDAINLWAGLEPTPTTRGRRGRVDVAALLCEVAPNARISIEPGDGTEVYGEESDMRRLLHVLVAHQSAGAGSGAAGDVDVRRAGDWIRLSVELGPDLSASEDIERRWLNRMAMRLGGRVELNGSTETLVLPADSSSDHAEVATLRRELQEAQELGETYARELAAVFGDMQTRPSEPKALRPQRAERLELLATMASIVVRSFKPLLTRVRKAAEDDGTVSELGEGAAFGLELLADLDQVHQLDGSEPPSATDVVALLGRAAEAVAGRARRRGVGVSVASDGPTVTTRTQSLLAVVRSLLINAISATPRDGEVRAQVELEAGSLLVRVVDGGAAVPASVGPELMSPHADPSQFGRPGGVALLVARIVAESLGGEVTVDESTDGATQTVARIPVAAA